MKITRHLYHPDQMHLYHPVQWRLYVLRRLQHARHTLETATATAAAAVVVASKRNHVKEYCDCLQDLLLMCCKAEKSRMWRDAHASPSMTIQSSRLGATNATVTTLIRITAQKKLIDVITCTKF